LMHSCKYWSCLTTRYAPATLDGILHRPSQWYWSYLKLEWRMLTSNQDFLILFSCIPCSSFWIIAQGACWQAIFTAGYKAVLHIHSIVEECEIVGLLHQINPKTKKPIRKKILFVKSGAVVVVRIQVCIVMINNGSGWPVFFYKHCHQNSSISKGSITLGVLCLVYDFSQKSH
jgi:hypothetical protein